MMVEVMEKTNHSFILVGIIALNLLNLLDAHYTYTGVTEGYLEELNPIMDYLLVLGSVEFFACKLLLVLLATVFLYIRRSHRLARLVIWSGCVLYSAIGCLHYFHLFNLS